jgi:thiamine pyrophosphate-dependent acetolactate synthase large subunit-like protein
MKLYDALAQAFVRERVGTCFALLGDANMHWAGALSGLGVECIYTRHEHAAVAGGAAFARSTGEVGCATVTCGPGLTQIMTILPIAVRARIPLVVFSGEAPLNKAWYNQGIDQKPFVDACGADYWSLHDPETMIADIHQAFAKARQDRKPVVIGVPFDLQQLPYDGELELPTSDTLVEPAQAIEPQGELIRRAAHWIDEASCPLVLAGLGAVAVEARVACIELAEKSGALLATTLPAKGLFHDQDFCLGVAGGFATERSKELFARSDLVIAIGSRLASHAFDGGKLTPNARVIHIDIDPQEMVQGRKAADLLIRSDARLGAEALVTAVSGRKAWRTAEMRQESAAALELPDDQQTPDGLLHPMAVVKKLSEVIPANCHIVNTSGHSAYYTAQMNRHPQDHYTVIRDFGAIGNGTSFALGIAAAHPERPVVLIDGDGSALMHIQELETMTRHQMKVLTIVMNDGAYGSEVHKLRADGVTDEGSVFGRPDIATVGRGFGLNGHTVTSLDGLPDLFEQFLNSSRSAIWDVHISDKIASPQILKAHKAAHV